ncbi:MAG: asparagine synthase (glutamine-hydrolyzing), partial [Gammaproteobacteria bacterium]|nr:asparagine synthase (glutamine-hydrolyzing) [Gammaproteobacteria bacterium]
GSDGFRALVMKMADQLKHRGPDDSGCWISEQLSIGIGHQRLSIVDLSPAGSQPMVSHGGNLVLSYNGEIYNHPDLRKQLETDGVSFRGHSDTEVLLAAIEHWGLESAIEKANGMFAFALIDLAAGELHLVRDRLGEKPLYYGWHRNSFIFASELKAFYVLPGWDPEIDRGSLTLYFRHNYIPAPYSIYRNIFKLPPACRLCVPVSISADRARFSEQPIVTPSSTEFAPVRYWTLFRRDNGFGQGGKSIESLLQASVSRQMVADVPVGAFLSGGVDSSTIVALMSEVSMHPVKTFTIGFDESEFNEAAHAARVAKHLGTEHYQYILSPQDALNLIPSLSTIYDEPFSDSSQLPTCLVSQVTRGEVTVALSGDGGDELFAGYDRYRVAKKLWSSLDKVPWPLRGLSGRLFATAPTGLLRLVAGLLNRVAPQAEGSLSTERLRRILELAASRTPDLLYQGLVSHELNPDKYVVGAFKPNYEFSGTPDYACDDALGNMMARDIRTYLPDDILCKVDRASMSVSLEVRVPLLSHDVVEAAWQQRPLTAAVHANDSKRAMREILYKRVPRSLIERPKSGFAVPLAEWLGGPLREWARDLVSPDLIRSQNLLEPNAVRQLVSEHYSGATDHKYRLWNILVFQSWLQQTGIRQGAS